MPCGLDMSNELAALLIGFRGSSALLGPSGLNLMISVGGALTLGEKVVSSTLRAVFLAVLGVDTSFDLL